MEFHPFFRGSISRMCKRNLLIFPCRESRTFSPRNTLFCAVLTCTCVAIFRHHILFQFVGTAPGIGFHSRVALPVDVENSIWNIEVYLQDLWNSSIESNYLCKHLPYHRIIYVYITYEFYKLTRQYYLSLSHTNWIWIFNWTL